MPRIIYVIVVCLLFLSTSNAQDKNHVGVDPFLPIFGTYQIQYERMINDKMSLGLSLGLKTSSGIFEVSGIDGNRITTNDFNFKGIKLLPEFRWYLQHTTAGLFGFYAGAFTKYQNFEDDISGLYVDNNQNENTIAINAKVRTLGFGLEVGYKLKIREHFYIDFLIAGPGITTNRIQLKEVQAIPIEFYDDLSVALSEYGFFEWLSTDFRINGNQDTDIVLPAFRYGIKIGYAF